MLLAIEGLQGIVKARRADAGAHVPLFGEEAPEVAAPPKVRTPGARSGGGRRPAQPSAQTSLNFGEGQETANPETKPAPVKPIETPKAPKSNLQENLEQTEGEIRHAPVEHLHAFDPETGEEVYHAKGDRKGVVVTPGMRGKMRGAVITHNHPPSQKAPEQHPDHPHDSIAPKDIETATQTRAAEIRAVTPTHTFSMKPGPGAKGFETADIDRFKRIYSKEKNNVEKEWEGRVNRGETTWDHFRHGGLHDIMSRVAPQMGWRYQATPHSAADGFDESSESGGPKDPEFEEKHPRGDAGRFTDKPEGEVSQEEPVSGAAKQPDTVKVQTPEGEEERPAEVHGKLALTQGPTGHEVIHVPSGRKMADTAGEESGRALIGQLQQAGINFDFEHPRDWDREHAARAMQIIREHGESDLPQRQPEAPQPAVPQVQPIEAAPEESTKPDKESTKPDAADTPESPAEEKELSQEAATAESTQEGAESHASGHSEEPEGTPAWKQTKEEYAQKKLTDRLQEARQALRGERDPRKKRMRERAVSHAQALLQEMEKPEEERSEGNQAHLEQLFGEHKQAVMEAQARGEEVPEEVAAGHAPKKRPEFLEGASENHRTAVNLRLNEPWEWGKAGTVREKLEDLVRSGAELKDTENRYGVHEYTLGGERIIPSMVEYVHYLQEHGVPEKEEKPAAPAVEEPVGKPQGAIFGNLYDTLQLGSAYLPEFDQALARAYGEGKVGQDSFNELRGLMDRIAEALRTREPQQLHGAAKAFARYVTNPPKAIETDPKIWKLGPDLSKIADAIDHHTARVDAAAPAVHTYALGASLDDVKRAGELKHEIAQYMLAADHAPSEAAKQENIRAAQDAYQEHEAIRRRSPGVGAVSGSKYVEMGMTQGDYERQQIKEGEQRRQEQGEVHQQGYTPDHLRAVLRGIGQSGSFKEAERVHGWPLISALRDAGLTEAYIEPSSGRLREILTSKGKLVREKLAPVPYVLLRREGQPETQGTPAQDVGEPEGDREKRNIYTPRLRPIGEGSLPRGVDYGPVYGHDGQPTDYGQFGLTETSRPLTPEEQRHFDMVHVPVDNAPRGSYPIYGRGSRFIEPSSGDLVEWDGRNTVKVLASASPSSVGREKELASPEVVHTHLIPETRRNIAAFGKPGVNYDTTGREGVAAPIDRSDSSIQHFQQGDRVVLPSGRHGTVTRILRSQLQPIFGSGPTRVSHSYLVKTDNGREEMFSGAEDMEREPEGGRPENVVPDIRTSDPGEKEHYEAPETVIRTYQSYMRDRAAALAAARRARKPASIKAHQENARFNKEAAEKYAVLINEWAAKNPEAAAQIPLYAAYQHTHGGGMSSPSPAADHAPGELTQHESPGGIPMTISKHFHTKRGVDVHIVTPGKWVDYDSYKRMESRAKRLGGWYSKAWQGSPAGFAFPTREAAEEFVSMPMQKALNETLVVEM